MVLLILGKTSNLLGILVFLVINIYTMMLVLGVHFCGDADK